MKHHLIRLKKLGFEIAILFAAVGLLPWDAYAQTSGSPRSARPQATRPKPPPVPAQELTEDSYQPRLTYDLGASVGTYNGKSYTEVTLGLNYFFLEYLAWRNAFFYRMADSSETSLYGLDSSLRAYLDLSASEGLGAVFFGGGGYRFASRGTSAPMAEAGLTLRLGGFVLGGGAKSIFYSAVTSGAPNDTQFFLILGGGGVL